MSFLTTPYYLPTPHLQQIRGRMGREQSPVVIGARLLDVDEGVRRLARLARESRLEGKWYGGVID